MCCSGCFGPYRGGPLFAHLWGLPGIHWVDRGSEEHGQMGLWREAPGSTHSLLRSQKLKWGNWKPRRTWGRRRKDNAGCQESLKNLQKRGSRFSSTPHLQGSVLCRGASLFFWVWKDYRAQGVQPPGFSDSEASDNQSPTKRASCRGAKEVTSSHKASRSCEPWLRATCAWDKVTLSY